MAKKYCRKNSEVNEQAVKTIDHRKIMTNRMSPTTITKMVDNIAMPFIVNKDKIFIFKLPANYVLFNRNGRHHGCTKQNNFSLEHLKIDRIHFLATSIIP